MKHDDWHLSYFCLPNFAFIDWQDNQEELVRITNYCPYDVEVSSPPPPELLVLLWWYIIIQGISHNWMCTLLLPNPREWAAERIKRYVKGLSTGPWRCEHSLFSFFWELREKKQRKTQSWGRETEKILQFSSYLLALGVSLPIMLCVFPCGDVQDQATSFFRNYYTAPLFSIYSFLWKIWL